MDLSDLFDAMTAQLISLAARVDELERQEVGASSVGAIPFIDPATAGNLVTQTAEGGLVDAGRSLGDISNLPAVRSASPTGFDNSAFPADFYVFLDGSWHFNARKYRAQTGTSVYISVSIGNDSTGNGTRATPYQSIHKAISEGADTIFIAPGVYTRYQAFNLTTVTKDLSILRWPGWEGDVLIVAAESLSWSVDGTYTNTYRATRSAVVDVVDGKNFDANGNYLRLTERASIADVDANESSWYTTGGVVYVRLRGDAIPDVTTWAMLAQNAKFEGDIQIYLEDLHFVGGGTSVPVLISNTGAGQSARLVARNCKFSHGHTNGFYCLGATAYLENCEAFANRRDGFNYTSLNSTQSIALELNCRGFDNGIGAGSDQGSSMHGTGRIIRVGGEYMRNQTQDLADVDSSHAWIVNCKTVGAPVGVIADGSAARIWVDATATINTTELRVTNGARIYYRRMWPATIDGAGGEIAKY